VSEETEGASSCPDGNEAIVDPAAVMLALAGASRKEADSFLRDQRSLIHIQKHHLLAFASIAITAGLGILIWNAAHSHADALGLLPRTASENAELARMSHG
jgi:hypothetical protein